MLTVLTTNWWALAVRGVLAVIFGVLAFLWPGLTLTALVLIFGAYAIADGIFSIVTAVAKSDPATGDWVLLLEGILGIIAGFIILLWPGMTAAFFLYLIALWAISSGAFQIAAALRLRKELTGEWLMVLGGIATVVFGVLMLLFPRAGALAVVWCIATYALVFGALLLSLAIRLRTAIRESPATERPGAGLWRVRPQ